MQVYTIDGGEGGGLAETGGHACSRAASQHFSAKVTTHSLVPVPPRLKKQANKTDRVDVQGQLGYVEAGMTMAVARLDPTAIAEQAGRDMQTRVHLRQAAQISTRAVLRWHRLVSAWERYCKANVLDVDQSACLLSLSSL